MKIAFDTKWLEAIGYLDDELRLTMLDAIFAYLQGQEPLLILEAQRVFNTLKPYLNEERDKRLALAERSRMNGQKGGRKPKGKEKGKPTKPTGFLRYLEMPEYKNRCERLQALDKWKEKHTPYIYANIRPLTQAEFNCLVEKYNSTQICDTLSQIENRKDLRKNYTNLYRTLLNWLKTNYGNA